jgi:RHS repeat-associated protein
VVSGSVEFDYDNHFRIDEEIVAGALVNIAYDQDGLVLTKGAMTVIREPASGRMTSTLLGGVTSTLTWSPFAELSKRDTSFGGQTLYAFEVERDDLGRPIKLTETLEGQTVERIYDYDAAGFLWSVSADGVEEATFFYDKNGNRTEVTTASGLESATHDAQDRLLTQGDSTFTWEAQGTLASRSSASGGTSTYETDIFGNLLEVVLPTGSSVTYAHDGQDRRIARYVDGAMTQGFLYLDRLRVAAELAPDGSLRSRFVHLSDGNVPAYMVRQGTTYALITDHRGSVRLVVSADTGAIVQRIDYDVWGQVLSDTNPGFQPFGYAGGLQDPDTGLVRFGARDYDPSLGHFIARDPVGFPSGTTNLYAYVDNAPSWGTDPTGTEKMLCDALQDLCNIERKVGPDEFTDHILDGTVMNEHIVRDGAFHNMDGKGGENYVHSDGKLYDLNYIQAGWALTDNMGYFGSLATYWGWARTVQLMSDTVDGAGLLAPLDFLNDRLFDSPNLRGQHMGSAGKTWHATFCSFAKSACPEACPE